MYVLKNDQLGEIITNKVLVLLVRNDGSPPLSDPRQIR